MIPDALTDKIVNLKSILARMGSVGVAFSAGVDSTFLLKVAADELGENVVAVTAKGAIYPVFEIEEARTLAMQFGVRLVELENDLLVDTQNFSINPPDRCYHCKLKLFQDILGMREELGVAHIVEGSNLDDLADYRPGQQALSELGIVSPLIIAGFTKDEIREAGKRLGISNWEKPAYACLASRFPYGTAITRDRLKQVERSEAVLRDVGFTGVRVRYHGDIARIELAAADINTLMADEKLKNEVARKIKSHGFIYVALDLQGYRAGSMNEPLDKLTQKQEGADGE